MKREQCERCKDWERMGLSSYCPPCDEAWFEKLDEVVDDEVVRQILETSDEDALAGKWPPLVQSATSEQ